MEMDASPLQNLINLDHWLFQQINSEWANKFFDLLMPWLTDLNHNRYVPVILLALLAYWVFKQRYRAMMYIIVLIVAVGSSDLIAYRAIKSVAERDRPEQAGVPVVLRTSHHSGSSFPSNHASNAFAAATVLASALPPGAPYFYLVAAAVAYSRVYVGVHFPGDVIAGAILGSLIALMLRVLFGPLLSKGDWTEKDRFERADTKASRDRRRDLTRKPRE